MKIGKPIQSEKIIHFRFFSFNNCLENFPVFNTPDTMLAHSGQPISTEPNYMVLKSVSVSKCSNMLLSIHYLTNENSRMQNILRKNVW